MSKCLMLDIEMSNVKLISMSNIKLGDVRHSNGERQIDLNIKPTSVQ